MSKLSLGARCKTCADKYAETSKDKNNPWFDDGADFSVVIEWMTKNDAIKTLQEKHCPTCGSDDWYFTDSAEH